MWDFTHTCNPINLPLTCESLLLCGFQDLFVGHEQVLLTPPCLIGFSLHQCIIHRSLVRHPWEPCVNPTRTSMGTPHVYVHGNLAPHHYLAPLAIFICWVFLFFHFSPGSLCVGHLGFLCPCWVGTMNTSPLSPHTTMSSDTTCWGDKHLGELPWVINITYRDTL